MTAPFSIVHALREGRSGIRQVGWFMAAVALGVAVLVGLYGFQQDAAAAARSEARGLLGGDVRLQGPNALEGRVEAILDSLAGSGSDVARGVSLASVVFAPGSGTARLMQVNAVESSFPVAGREDGEGGEIRSHLAAGGGIAADPQVLRQLGVEAGDSVRIGNAELEVLGSVSGFPIDLGIQWTVGPPVFMSLDDLPRAGILGFGSLAQYRAWIAFPSEDARDAFVRRHRGELRALGVSMRTAGQEAEALAAGFEELSRFLGLVGLLALLLGGIGVGSAVHVYLRGKVPSIAVLRCLGARRATLFRAYLLQTTVLGAGGALLGVLGGVLLQFALPGILSAFLPFELSPRLRLEAVGAGLLLGTWVAVVFSLFPLARVQGVSPLAALRISAAEGHGVSWPARLGIGSLLVGSLLGVTALQLGGRLLVALVVTLSLACVVGALALIAAGLMRTTRVLLPIRAPFALRQGLSGLFRPQNQTTTVVTALGLGTFLMAALLVVEEGLRSQLSFEASPDQPTLLLFDIQVDQREGVEALLGAERIEGAFIPIVPARLQEVGGVTAASLLERRRPGQTWMYRRVYRNTYAEAHGSDLPLVAGAWWGAEDEDARVREAVAEGAARVSLEADLARDLEVDVGDRITWDVQGIPVVSVVSSIRSVDWGSFQPNFFAIFEPGSLDGAPATFVVLVSASEAASRERIQEGLVTDFPNVSFLDISMVQEVLERITGRIALVFRSMAAFILGGGALVLLASLVTSRFRRRRESAILKTLGASGATLRGVLLSEYASLGAIGGASGVLLGGMGGHLLLRWQFDMGGGLPWATLASLWMGVLLLAVAVGWSVSGPVLRAPPVAVLREGEREGG